MLRSAILAKEKKTAAADKLLAEFTSKESRSSLDPLFMRSQLLAATGSPQQAAQLLAELPEQTKNRGAVVATQAALLERFGEHDSSEDFVSKALKWWKENKQNYSESEVCSSVAWCLDHLAGLKLRSGNTAGAAGLYNRVLELQLDEVDRAQVVSKLSRVLAITDPSASEVLEASLPEVAEVKSADVDKLESSGKGAGAARKGDNSGKQGMTTDDAGKPKKKRKRKKQLPKNFDPDNPGPPPDPERWLPKWQRSGYRKRRRRKDDHVKGSQGAGKVDDTLDRTKHQPDASTSSRTNTRAKTPPRTSGGRRKGGRR